VGFENRTTLAPFQRFFRWQWLLNEGHTDAVRQIVLSEDFMFSASLDSSAKQWNKNNAELIKSFSVTPGKNVYSVAVSAGGEFLFTGTQDSSAALLQWRISDGARMRSFQGSISIKLKIKDTLLQLSS
jgi:WD40 repeat protein